ncbi:hypothetical protein [Lewinella sp. W8]|uniref:hypothetical protein n=1 Tax=Lewinella sp. W8 TaxID=2528208 RepID=UPI001067CE88|nr:hypothetical protein [Lewinella sp. W8]MTB53835.1 hypothetical protein [Lewinella sp. W8]
MIRSRQSLQIGQQRLLVELRLDGGHRDYLYTGEAVRGELVLTNTGEGRLVIEEADIRLAEVRRSNKKSYTKPSWDSLSLGKITLEAGEKRVISLRELDSFQQHSFSYKHLHYENQLVIEGFAYVSSWAPERKSHRQRPSAHDFRVTLPVPVRKPPSFYYVPEGLYSTEQYSGSALLSLLGLIGGWIYTTMKFELDLVLSLHLLLVLVVLLITAARFQNLTVFRETKVEIIPNPGGPMVLRMLDLGSAFQRSLRVGYQIFEQFELREEGQVITRRALLKSTVVRVADHAQPHGPFLELKLPWPKECFPLPVMGSKNPRNLHWRMVVWHTSVWGKVAEVSWPLDVREERLAVPKEENDTLDLPLIEPASFPDRAPTPLQAQLDDDSTQ